MKEKLRFISLKYFHGFKSSRVFSPVFTRHDVNLLKEFAADKSIVVTKPDKGRGVVILDKTSYIDKVKSILSDATKFHLINEPVLKTIRQVEDKVNRIISKLKKLSMISDSVYKELHVSGSTPGILYGLPKVHKVLVPLRPIFAACGTPTYKLAKFLVPLLSTLTVNEYTIKNSSEFVNSLSGLELTSDMVMASFDVQNLFTNIPVKETIEITISELFRNNCVDIAGITAKYFRSLLEVAVLNSYFIFNNLLYKQVDGVGMGLPLGPTFANIFLCFHEKKWLNNCPADFRPVTYKRFIDDTFLIFRHSSHVDKFLGFLNVQHPNIKFTKEVEQSGKLPFLDVCVRRVGSKLETSVYRKPTFTGLGTSFFSFIPLAVKRAITLTAIYRAFSISSSFQLFHRELDFLKRFFKNNGFPVHLFDCSVKDFFDKKYDLSPKACTLVQLRNLKNILFFRILVSSL